MTDKELDEKLDKEYYSGRINDDVYGINAEISSVPSEKTMENKRKTRFLSDMDIDEVFERPEFLIQDVLDTGSFTTIFGQYGCGKTFLAIDMALHVSTGKPWCGHETNKNSVYYFWRG